MIHPALQSNRHMADSEALVYASQSSKCLEP